MTTQKQQIHSQNNAQPHSYEVGKTGKNNQSVSNIFKLVHKSINVFGQQGFVEKLEAMLAQTEFANKHYRYIIEHILDLVCLEWKHEKIKKQNLFKHKRGITSDARRMAILLIKRNVEENNHMVGQFFGRGRTMPYKVEKDFEKLNPADKHDNKFIELFNKLDYNVKKFIISRQKAE